MTELKRVLHTLKGGARMAGIAAMGDLSHELESLVIQLGDEPVGIDDRILEVAQASLDELARMRDYVGAGRPVTPARDLITRIRLVAKAARRWRRRPHRPRLRPSGCAGHAGSRARAGAHCAGTAADGRGADVAAPMATPAPAPEAGRRGIGRAGGGSGRARRRPCASLPPARRRATPRPTAARSRAWTRTCSTTC